MTGKNLYRALNEIDDGLIQEANEPAPRRKFMGLRRSRWAGIAACLALMVCLALAVQALRGESPFSAKRYDAAAAAESINSELAMAVLHDYKNIYYTEKGSAKIKKQSILMDYTLENFFSEWKRLNHVSEQVKLLEGKIESNGHEVRTGSTVAYVVGDTHILNLTLSKEFLKESNQTVLMATLEKTFQDRYRSYQAINIIVDGKIRNH